MFRWMILLILGCAIAISGYYRYLARQHGETIARRREGWRLILLRAMVSFPLLAAILAYILNPSWMVWTEFAAPAWLRWTGLGLGLLMLLVVHWVLRTLGRNVSETVLTKTDHELVMSGPYRWIRHPLYTTGLTLLVSVGLMAANWFILVFTALVALFFRIIVIPMEERALIERFGDEYRAYMRRTGRLLPRALWPSVLQ